MASYDNSPSIIPATHRPRDILYVFLLIGNVLIIALFDAICVYPPQFVPARMLALHAWYKDYFNDQLVITQPPWFRFFVITEVSYQLPLSAWAAWALWKRSPNAPVHLLVWSIVVCGTTMTCLFEFYHNQLMTAQEKNILIALYGGYSAIFGVIGFDMSCRIQRTLATAEHIQQTKKNQ